MLKKIKPEIKLFIIAIAIPLLVGAASALLTMGNMDLYSEVKVPPLSPPSPIFPVVWTVLYILMGISSALIIKDRETDPPAAARGLMAYIISLGFNFAWSIFFFNLRAFLFSFVWLLGLLALIILTIHFYKKVNKTAAYLQIPYAVWVAFAGYLNIAIYFLNR